MGIEGRCANPWEEGAVPHAHRTSNGHILLRVGIPEETATRLLRHHETHPCPQDVQPWQERIHWAIRSFNDAQRRDYATNQTHAPTPISYPTAAAIISELSHADLNAGVRRTGTNPDGDI